MNTQEKLKIVAQTDPQGRVIVQNIPDQFLGELAQEVTNFAETTRGNQSWVLIYTPETDKLEISAVCSDVYGKPINTLQREIEDHEESKEQIKEFILRASEQNFMKQAQEQILLSLAQQELAKVYAAQEPKEEEAEAPAKKTAKKRTKAAAIKE